jgi:hypothetical protein
LAFWIVAPPAVQGATFEKHGRAYPGPIISGVSFNVKNNAFLDGLFHLFKNAATEI